jgi:anthranilate synthase/aminodeoxychorismate synthase-like glutamine amidotransferase
MIHRDDLPEGDDGLMPAGRRILLVDHRDSFTYNLVHLLRSLGAQVTAKDSRSVSAEDWTCATGILLGPGPHGPSDVPESLDLLHAAAEEKIPILGVCLGLQIIGAAFSGRIRRATRTAHGVVSRIDHRGDGLFEGLANPGHFVRYHSLVLEEPLPDGFEISARDEDGDVAAISHRKLPIWGIQFHPESVLSEEGGMLLGNYLRMVGTRKEIEPQRSQRTQR